jgi:selenocysteine-specific elongation factor
VQFSFDEPICSLPGDPYILRGSFLVRTIGGGTILDIEAKRHKKGEVQRIKEALLSGSDVKRAEYQLLKGAYAGVSREKLYALVGATERKGEEIIRRLEEHGRAISFPSFLVHTSVFNAYERMLERELGTFFSRNPQKVGMSKEELRSRLPAVPQAVFQRALLELTKEGAFEVDRDMVKLKGVAERTEEIERLEEKIEELLLKGGLTPPSPKELSLLLSLSEAYLRDLIERLIHKGKVVKVRTDMFFHREPLEAFKEKSLALLREKREVGIQDFKHVFDLSRKYLIPLVEYLDSVKLTVRVGEKRILRGA